MSECDDLPTNDLDTIKKLVSKALNKNQLLILNSIENNEKESMNCLLNRISNRHSISLSTLKLNAKILRNLGLVHSNGFVEISQSGLLVKQLLR